MPKFIDAIFAKTSPKRAFSMTKNERFSLVFMKTRSINSGKGIDTEKSIPLAYVAWRAGTTNRVVVPDRQAGNRFRVSLKGLQIPSQICF